MRLRHPAAELLSAYAAALERGWSPDPGHEAAAGERLAGLRADPEALPGHLNHPHRPGTRLPQRLFWVWDEAGDSWA